METSIVIARIMGPPFVIAALHLFLYRKHVQKVMDEMMKSEAALFFGGFAALVMGMIFVTLHNVWEGWPIIITLIGWIGLAKGTTLMLWPKVSKGMVAYVGKSSSMVPLGGLIALVLGGYLCYAGYFM